ncbi:hypothetical protein [Paraflavitalea sp. CAU 1676]|uniref:hypothetical protein n=1 Tax=Paraflavitalea sp. CAU 1676 TaxID=3032598 RepID=UPI0023D985A9|nr:hypothetical protein [Paraflavitalea sp. CAU 1676]MDF2188915.1 hypothetical protein [Paraflavitalea sp. CAU 1676]
MKDIFLNRWVSGNLTAYIVGLGLFHPLIAHGFTGNHDKLLTMPQLIMHTFSLVLFVLLIIRSQIGMYQLVGDPVNFKWWPLLLISPLAFWLGYYTLYIPFDILFLFLSIGVITARQFRDYVKFPTKWIRQCIAIHFLAALTGIIAGLGAYLLFYKGMPDLIRDIATWLTISIPSSLVIAYLLKRCLKEQILMPAEQLILLED